MASINEITWSIYGCYRLALKDKNALSLFNLSSTGFWTSFSAILLGLIVTLLQKGIEFNLASTNVSFFQFITLFGVAIVISWSCYLLAVGIVSKYMGFSAQFSTFVIVYNWSQLAIISIWFLFSILVMGLIGPQAVTLLGLVFIAASYLYLWYIIVVTLQVSSMLAIALTFMEFLIAIFIQQALLSAVF